MVMPVASIFSISVVAVIIIIIVVLVVFDAVAAVVVVIVVATNLGQKMETPVGSIFPILVYLGSLSVMSTDTILSVCNAKEAMVSYHCCRC
jgi:hypothetical protein